MKKRLFTLLLATIVGFVYLSAEQYVHLALIVNDGTKVTYSLKQKPQITFTETDIVVRNKNMEIIYPIDQTAKFEYEMAEDNSEAIDIVSEETIFDYEDDALLFKHLNENTIINIYTLTGQPVLSKNIMTAGEYILPLNILPDGVYLVNINTLTYKIVKK